MKRPRDHDVMFSEDGRPNAKRSLIGCNHRPEPGAIDQDNNGPITEAEDNRCPSTNSEEDSTSKTINLHRYFKPENGRIALPLKGRSNVVNNTSMDVCPAQVSAEICRICFSPAGSASAATLPVGQMTIAGVAFLTPAIIDTDAAESTPANLPIFMQHCHICDRPLCPQCVIRCDLCHGVSCTFCIKKNYYDGLSTIGSGDHLVCVGCCGDQFAA